MTAPGAIAGVLGWFFFLAHRALGYGFNPDDAMLMDFAVSRPLAYNLQSCIFFWNGYVRPLGTLFYLAIYRTFGYWSPPYRIAAFLLIALNLVLVYRLARAVTRSRTAAWLVLLLSSFHGQLWDIYGSTGTVFDLLCQLFCLLAVTFWFDSGRTPAWRTALLAGLMTVGAVESKEMGVVLPAVLLIGDVLFRPRRVRYSGVAISAAASVIFLLGRFAQKTAVTGNPAFTPIVKLPHFVHASAYYFSFLLNTQPLRDETVVVLLFVALGLAVGLRNRVMCFGFAYYFFTLLPLCFAPLRTGYALYVPFTGAALYGVALFLDLRRRATANTSSLWLRHALTAAFAICIIVTQFLANRKLKADQAGPGYLPELEAVTTGLRRAWPHLPHGTAVTIVNDPFYGDRNPPEFALHDLYNDPSLSIRQIRWNPERGPEQLEGAEHALLFVGNDSWRFGDQDETGHIVDGRPPGTVPMRSPLAGLNIVRDVGGAMADGTRWAMADPELVFSLPARPAQAPVTFTIDFDVPQAILERTGPLQLRFQVGAHAPESVTFTESGPGQYSVPVTGIDGPLLRVKIHAMNPYVSPGGTKLSFLLKGAGVGTP